VSHAFGSTFVRIAATTLMAQIVRVSSAVNVDFCCGEEMVEVALSGISLSIHSAYQSECSDQRAHERH
jgi:hypothetical protein